MGRGNKFNTGSNLATNKPTCGGHSKSGLPKVLGMTTRNNADLARLGVKPGTSPGLPCTGSLYTTRHNQVCAGGVGKHVLMRNCNTSKSGVISEPDDYVIPDDDGSPSIYKLRNFQPSTASIMSEIIEMESQSDFNYLPNNFDISKLTESQKNFINNILKNNTEKTEDLYLILTFENSFRVFYKSENDSLDEVPGDADIFNCMSLKDYFLGLSETPDAPPLTEITEQLLSSQFYLLYQTVEPDPVIKVEVTPDDSRFMEFNNEFLLYQLENYEEIILTDKGGSSNNYLDEQDYKLLIVAPPGKYLELGNIKVNYEDGFDFLILKNGTFNQVENQGSLQEENVILNTGELTQSPEYDGSYYEKEIGKLGYNALILEFKSDYNVTYSGWQIPITIYCVPQAAVADPNP